MKTLYKKTMPARDLPNTWREEGQFAPDEQVTVLIEPADRELAQARSLETIMDIISRRAQQRGLTEEKLQEILNDPD